MEEPQDYYSNGSSTNVSRKGSACFPLPGDDDEERSQFNKKLSKALTVSIKSFNSTEGERGKF